MSDLADALGEPASRDIELDELRSALARISRQLEKERFRTEALVAAVYQAARDASLIVGRAKVPRPPKDARRKGEEVALVYTTDWQAGKATDSFDLDVLHRRIMQMVEKVARITEIQRADHPVRRCVLMPGGDMVEGVTVFPGQAWEVHAGLYEQLFRASRILEEAVDGLLQVFDEVEVWPIHGNHGRIGRRGEVPRNDNVDRILYRITSERFADEPRATWHLPETWKQHVAIGNYTVLLVHGDQIKHFGGNLPAYGIVKKVLGWAAGVLDPFTDAYLGHFHTQQVLQLSNGRMVYMTGSPESDNEYASEFLAAKGSPRQRLHYVDPEKGRVTSHYDLELD